MPDCCMEPINMKKRIKPLFFPKIRFWSCFLLTSLSFLMLLPDILSAKQPEHTRTIVVTGTGFIIKNDTASAREKAIKEGLVAALGLVFAGQIPLDLLISNFEPLNDIIYTKTDTFISGYRVLTETQYKDLYRVVIQARVSIAKVKKQLSKMGIMHGSKKMPRVLFLISEQNLEDLLPRYWWQEGAHLVETSAEITMAEVMQKKGFVIAAHTAAPQLPENEAILDSPDASNSTAMALGIRYKADIVIIGNALAEPTQNKLGENMLSYKGTLLARAIRAGTGEEIATTFQASTAMDSDEIAGGLEAISHASTIAAEDLSLQIAADFDQRKKQSSKILIRVKGTDHLANFVRLRRAIDSIPGVRGILTSEMKSNETTLVVDYMGSARELAESLLLKSFESFGITLSEVTPEELMIELMPKPGF